MAEYRNVEVHVHAITWGKAAVASPGALHPRDVGIAQPASRKPGTLAVPGFFQCFFDVSRCEWRGRANRGRPLR